MTLNRREFLGGFAALTATGGKVMTTGEALMWPRGGENVTPTLEKYGLPAVAWAVFTRERVVSLGFGGVRRVGSSRRIEAGDLWHLGSNTKSMTATLIGVLVEKEKLRWDSTLTEFFPEFKPEIKLAYGAVTVDLLLSHRSGISGNTYGKSLNEWHTTKTDLPTQRKEFAKLVLKSEPTSVPGQKFEYSNANYILLGAIAEQAGGEPYETLMRRYLFEPLGMKSAGFGAIGNPKKNDQPWPHTLTGGISVPVNSPVYPDNPAILSSAGTGHCDLFDYVVYAHFHLLEGKSGKVLRKSETWKHLHLPIGEGTYAGGWVVIDKSPGGTLLAHEGSNTMNHSLILLSPEKQFGVVVLTNTGSPQVEVLSGIVNQIASEQLVKRKFELGLS